MDEEEKKQTEGIDITELTTAFNDLEAANKADDDEGVNKALETLKKLIDNALNAETDEEDTDEADPFDKAVDKYK
ncbi:hypothetical protein [Weissella ceti]|uniref:Uncharacterized protein n=1 Tax=Weissella ceti TaxID=759620 RepID=A0A088GGG6_9LACO|nr:hypothetical protein [Weissella ceti]AIM63071.1 hypothetical protein WS74_0819 [Weissella ceti]